MTSFVCCRGRQSLLLVATLGRLGGDHFGALDAGTERIEHLPLDDRALLLLGPFLSCARRREGRQQGAQNHDRPAGPAGEGTAFCLRPLVHCLVVRKNQPASTHRVRGIGGDTTSRSESYRNTS